MSDERPITLPPCKKRKRVDGIDMCMAIGCCDVGDMACECWICFDEHGKCIKKERCEN